MMRFGSLDHRVAPELYERIRRRLIRTLLTCTFRYECADHGFDRNGHSPYHPEAAALACRRTLDFLA